MVNIITICGTVISAVLGILKIIEIKKHLIESKKHLNVIVEFKKSNYEMENGDQMMKTIQVKILNKTNYNISFQNIVFIASRYFFFIPFKLRVIRFLNEDDIKITHFMSGESKIFKYEMSYIHSDGNRNIDILKDKKLKNHYIQARIIYPDDSFTDSKKGILISSILNN